MRKGFTLIEMIVAMALVLVIAGIGGAISFRAVQNQQIEQEKEKLAETLRQARSNALSGKKVSCVTLTGWRVVIISGSYSLQEVCQAGGPFTLKTFTYPSTISITNTTVVFPVLGQNVGAATINVSGYGLPAKQINVLTSGAIQ